MESEDKKCTTLHRHPQKKRTQELRDSWFLVNAWFTGDKTHLLTSKHLLIVPVHSQIPEHSAWTLAGCPPFHSSPINTDHFKLSKDLPVTCIACVSPVTILLLFPNKMFLVIKTCLNLPLYLVHRVYKQVNSSSYLVYRVQ